MRQKVSVGQEVQKIRNREHERFNEEISQEKLQPWEKKEEKAGLLVDRMLLRAMK